MFTGKPDRAFRSARTAGASRHLLVDVEQISNLTDTSDLDVTNTTTQFGLEVYGSGQATGVVADSGSAEVSSISEPLNLIPLTDPMFAPLQLHASGTVL